MARNNAVIPDQSQGKKLRWPRVAQLLRELKSTREIAEIISEETGESIGHVTISRDRKALLAEAQEQRIESAGLWLEESLQQFEALAKELIPIAFSTIEKLQGDGEKPTLDDIAKYKGKFSAIDRLIVVFDKMNELKGLRKGPAISIQTGDDANVTISDSEAITDLMGLFQSGKMESDQETISPAED